jgi:hypothetical protein
MKKNMKFFGLVAMTLVIGISLIACASAPAIVPPDPANPFNGTWIGTGGNRYMHVITGNEGAWYARGLWGWKKYAIYTIEQKDSEYITSNHWRISVNGNILTVEEMTYERLTE